MRLRSAGWVASVVLLAAGCGGGGGNGGGGGTTSKTTPTVAAWPAASAITYGQTLASSTLTGGTASVSGSFAWTTASTSPGAGTQAESVTFTPTDTTDYYTVTGSVNVTVNKATPTVTAWPTANAITYGQTLASSTLTGGTASVSGTFAWTTSTTSPGAGTASQGVTFTPTDATNYSTMTGTASVTVNKATPTVTAWPTASAITAGQTLASSTLSGGAASVSGTFAWTAPATVPGAGIASESVTFTPTDATDYNTVTGTVSVTVNSALAPTVASTVPASGATNENIGNALSATFSIAMDSSTLTTSTFTLTAAGGASVSGLVTYNSSTATATFTPNASLAYSTAYTATITTGAKSSVGTPLASAYVWTFTTGANPNLVTIDFGTTYQTIRGFGGSTAWMGALPSTQMNALFGTGSGQIGLSILRVRIDPSGSSSNGWVTTNWGQELTNAEGAIAANPNAIVIAAPWTPPPSMKSNSSTVMGTLNTSSYADYANYLEDFVTYFANGNVNLYAISMQNEPDATVTYESCTWTPAAMDAWVESLTANGATDPLTTRLMMPESQNFLTSYSDPTLNDASAVGNVAIVAGHLYGVSPAYYSNAVSKGKEVWETEHYFQPAAGSLYSQGRPGISDALKAALEIHNSLVTGQYNAYLWWWVIDWNPGTGVDNSGLLDPSNNPTYYGWAMAQFAHFIQPGFVRASATANPLSGVYVSAYEGNGHYVIVAINSNTSSSSLSFTVSNASATSLTPYQTDANGGLAAQTAVSVTNGQFNYTLPAQSIITFYQ